MNPPNGEAPAPARARGLIGCDVSDLPRVEDTTFSAPRQYTRLPHDVIDSPAARALSGNGFALLVEFIRAWCRNTFNGTRPAHSIAFCHRGYPRRCNRRTFDKARGELEAAGFIECVNRRWARYRWAAGEGWRRK